MTTKDILLVVVIPLILAEVGPWCGWLAARLLPWAAKLRYGNTERAAVRLEEWSNDLDSIPGQLTKLAYATGQLAAGSTVSVRRKTKSPLQKTRKQDLTDPNDIIVSIDGATIYEQVIAALAPVPDSEAETFARHLYAELLNGESLAATLHSVDWRATE